MAQTMAQHLRESGREEGAAETAQKIFLKLLQWRFDSVPETVIQRITLIRDVSRLEALIDMALNAATLEEIDSEIDDREQPSEFVAIERCLVNQHIEHSTDKEEADSVVWSMARMLYAEGFAKGYVETVERRYAQYYEQGIARHREEGAIQARQGAILELLQFRFNFVPKNVVEPLTLIRDPSRLDALIETILNAKTLEEIESEICNRE